LLRHRRV